MRSVLNSLHSLSTRTRLTLLYLFIFGSTLILFCSLLYRNFTLNQQNEFDIALYNHAVDIAQGISVDPLGHLTVSPDALSSGGKIFPFSIGNVFIRVLSLNGSEIARSRNLGNADVPSFKKSWGLLVQNRGIFHTMTAQELRIKTAPGRPQLFRLLTTLSPGRPTQDYVLQVGVPQAFLTQVTSDLKRFLWISIPLTLIAATFGGFYLSRRAMAPVSQMIEKANSLRPDHLSERIPVPPADDELRSLALTLNALLEKLQVSFESQERFIADASHELKTPLAILRGELDVFRSRDRSPEEVTAFINSALQELTHLSRLVEDLLIIARMDTQSHQLAKKLTHFEELVIEVISKLEVLGRPKGVKVRLNLAEQPDSTPIQDALFSVHADGDLLKILIKNLVENAIKYSPSGGRVDVQVKSDANWILLEVIDHGPGIPKEIQPKVFERFFRGPGASESAQGAGLGLAIAQKIAELHQGTITVQSVPFQKTCFTTQIKRF